MILVVDDFLRPLEAQNLEQTLIVAKYVDGRVTAHNEAKLVKNVLKLDTEDPYSAPKHVQVVNAIRNAVDGHKLLRSAVRPKLMAIPMVNRYDEGMGYGEHLDSPMMLGDGINPMRTDVSCTIFLSNPASYEGGELVIKTDIGEVNFKCRAGEAVIYPANLLHHVKPVTKGTRLVVVTWFQSFVRSLEQRRILFDLDQSLAHLSNYFDTPNSPVKASLLRARSSHFSLLRMWSE